MSLQELLGTITERLTAAAKVRNVYGEPVTVSGRTIIPVARVRYAFGAGGGGKGTPESPSGGGGGKVSAKPCGALEITAEGSR